jgi:hypothetical protein
MGPIPQYYFVNGKKLYDLHLPYLGYIQEHYKDQRESDDVDYRNNSVSLYNDDFVYNALNNSDGKTP